MESPFHGDQKTYSSGLSHWDIKIPPVKMWVKILMSIWKNLKNHKIHGCVPWTNWSVDQFQMEKRNNCNLNIFSSIPPIFWNFWKNSIHQSIDVHDKSSKQFHGYGWFKTVNKNQVPIGLFQTYFQTNKSGFLPSSKNYMKSQF